MKNIFHTVILLGFLLAFNGKGFSQTYTDKEMGFNETRLTQELRKRGVPEAEIAAYIQLERELYTAMYRDMQAEIAKLKQDMVTGDNQDLPAETNRTTSTDGATDTLESTGTEVPIDPTDPGIPTGPEMPIGPGSCEEAVPVSTQQRNALIAFYDATGGNNWTNNTNWKTDLPVCRWHGVTVKDGKVTALVLPNNNLSRTLRDASLDDLIHIKFINLSNNNISGSIPSNLASLSSLYALSLGNNQLSGAVPYIPSLVELPPTEILGFMINDNKFVFSDIESSYTSYNPNDRFFYNYSPQAKVDSPLTVNKNATESYTFSTNLNSPNNSYQWYKDGIAIPSATSRNYTKTNLTTADAGTYYVRITNSVIDQLILQRHDIVLNITAACSVPLSERNALVALYNATDGANWHNTWDLTEPVCNWYGVTVEGGHVVHLNLVNNQLSGPIPDAFWDLPELVYLNLHTNRITGTISSLIARLTKLQYLYLYSNQLTGSIPPEIGRLSKLYRLSISNNRLTGSIPPELGDLSELHRLYLLINNLEGEIPKELGRLNKLQRLSLGYNNLTESIPDEIGDMEVLEDLWLPFNNLSGRLPSTLVDLGMLRSIDFQYNNISGIVPPGLKDIGTLNNFRLNNNALVFNDFETEHSTYVANISNYTYTPQAKVDQELTISKNVGQSYTFTTSLSNPNNSYQWYKNGTAIVGATSKSYTIPILALTDTGTYYVRATNSIVTGLTLQRHDIILNVSTCTVPPSERTALIALYNNTDGVNWKNNTNWLDPNEPVCNWFGVTVEGGHVTELILNNNLLSGLIPDAFWNLPELIHLSLHTNRITGTISPLIANLAKLQYLYLYTNQLTNSIPPEIGQLSKLYRLSISNNRLTGTIPPELGDLSELHRLYLLINNLEGEIPKELGRLDKLQRLSLGYNNLTGSIPPELGEMEVLEDLWLPRNNLSGSLPSSLEDLVMLKSLDVQNNNISGSVPSGLKDIETLNDVRLKNNALVFSDFENEHTIYSGYSIYNYIPQAKVDEEQTLYIKTGDPFTLTTTALTSPKNHYQWQISRDGGATYTNIGTDSDTYTVAAASSTDAGIYRFLATNDIVNGLTLERHSIKVNVTPTGASNVCLSGISLTVNDGTSNVVNNNLTLEMLDDSEIIQVTAKVSKGIKIDDSEVILDESFDTTGTISFQCDEDGIPCSYIYKGFEISYFIETTTGIYNASEVFSASSLSLGLGAYRADFECTAPITYPDDDNTFCLNDYDDGPVVANLFPRGATVLWYTTATGGTPLNTTDEIPLDTGASGITYWWDDTADTTPTRTAATVIVFDTPEGPPEQTFSIYDPTHPTIADIEIYNSGNPVYWYTSPVSDIQLSNTTPLNDGSTYYASTCNALDVDCACRFPVTITIGVLPPTASVMQLLCETSTLADVVLELEPGLISVWYDSATGGNMLGSDTVVENETRYYVAQRDPATGDESGARLLIYVFTRTIDPPVIPENPQRFYANESRTVGDLLAYGENITWHTQPEDGFEYTSTTGLVDGQTYYAQQVVDGCVSSGRSALTVAFSPLNAEPLVGCEFFRPELLGHYVIDAWVNEREVTTETITGVPFNNSDESLLFVNLLNHLKDRLLSGDKDKFDFPDAYEPEFSGGEPEFDFSPLMAFIEGLAVDEKKLIVYGFEPERDDYGRTIGFSFYLNKKDWEDGMGIRQFKYLSPTFTYTVPDIRGSGVVQVSRTVHYPILDNIWNTSEEFLNFTKVEVSAGKFLIHSDFHLDTPDLTVHKSEIGNLTATNAIKSNSSYQKYTEVAYQAPITYTKAAIEITFLDESGNPIGTPITLQPQGKIIDKWQKITGDFVVPNDAGSMTIALKNDDTNKIAYYDDLRILPIDSNMKTFVYHPENQRLTSELDENNYATYYEYDAEGGLIRVKKETVKGVYTIQETRSGNVKNTN